MGRESYCCDGCAIGQGDSTGSSCFLLLRFVLRRGLVLCERGA